MSKAKRKRDSTVDGEEDLEPVTEEPTTSTSSRAAALAAFTGTGADLAVSLQTSSLDALRTSLTTLRTLSSRNSHDEKISPSDRRIQLAAEFCRAGGIGQSNPSQDNRRGLVNAWDFIDNQEQVSLLPIPLFVLSNLISLLGSHQPTHEIADEIIQTLLPASASPANIDTTQSQKANEDHYWNRLQSYLSLSGGKNEPSSKVKAIQNRGSQEVVTMATLRLLLEMTTFAGGKYARNVFDSMNWTMKSLPRLLSMRRRTNNHKKAAKTISKPKNAVTLDRPDIRTLWILFLLSFLCSSTGVNQPVSLQEAALSLGKEFLPSILKGLTNDSPQIVVHVLMSLHAGLISDEAAVKLPRSKVVGFFSEWACKELLTLYDREADLVSVVATGERHSIADVVHHFMLALCTHPGRGICYVDHGWYGRQQQSLYSNEDDDDKEPQDEANESTRAVFNKILLGLLKSLSPTRSSKQAELTLRILSASQELLSPFLQASTGSLSSASVEPRSMSIAWLSTAAFMGRVLGTPLPEASKWEESPPSLDRCIHSLLPASFTKAGLVRGIQQKDKLTRHSALVLLSRVLDRLHRFKFLCQNVASLYDNEIKYSPLQVLAEESSTKDQEEAILRGEYNCDIDQKKPWMKVCNEVINEARQRIPDLSAILSSIDVDSKQKKAEEEADTTSKRAMMIVEAALRSSRLHYQVFEEASTTDLGKLLSNASLSTVHHDDVTAEDDSNQRLSLVCRLHAIHILTLFAQRNAGGVDLFVRQSSKDTTAFRHLLRLATSSTQDQVKEASRELVKEAMSGTILFEHNLKEWEVWQYALDKNSDILLDFFDECVQRCLKTPYRYIEMARAVLPDLQDTLCASPIFFVMAEQYVIRLQSGLLEDDYAKLAFWEFSERYIPALLALNGIEITRPLVNMMRSNTFEALAVDDQRPTNGEERKISNQSRAAIGNVYLRIEMRIGLLMGGIRVQYSSQEGLLQYASGATPKIALDGESEGNLHPSDLIWMDTRGIIPSGVTVDWDTLLFSPIETKMMLFFIQELLTSSAQSLEDGKHLLNLTLTHGQIETKELVDLLNDHLKLYTMNSLFGTTLLQAISEAPLDLDNTSSKLVISDLQENGAPIRHDTEAEYMSENLIKAWPLLSKHFKDHMLESETDSRLYIEAASGYGFLQTEQKLKLLLRLKELIKTSKSSRVVRNGLLILNKFTTDLDPSTSDKLPIDFSPLDLKTEIVGKLLRRTDVADYDDILCILLGADRSLCQYFYKVHLSKIQGAKLANLVPLSLAQVTMTVAATENLEGLTDPAQYQPLIKACIARLFDATQTTVIPLAQTTLDLFKLSGLTASDLEIYLQEALPERPVDTFKISAILFAREMLRQNSADWLESSFFLQSLLDKSLLWLVRRFAEDQEESMETMQGVEAFLSLLDVCCQCLSFTSKSFLKAHLVEPVLLAAVANRLSSKVHLQLIRRLIKLSDLKTTLLEKLIADILRSREATADENNCDEVVNMAYDTVQKDESICRADLMASLVKLYKGTLSKTDRKVMKLFHLHESKQGVSALSYLQNWEAIPKQAVGEIDLGLLSRLDSNRVHETCLKFPRSRGFEDLLASGYSNDSDESITRNAVYDPLLILAGTGALLTRDEPISGLHWLELIRTNALGVIVCCLSSRWPSTRSIAMSILSKVYTRVATADFQEKDHMLLVLDFARNSYTTEDVRELACPASLPLTTTLFVAHSLRSLGIPSLYLYPLISRFMLQRPTSDPTDVPLLYNFLYSSSNQSTTAKSEKIFILRYLLACIKYGGSNEWKIMKRRHVWDSICSLYAAESIEGSIKRIIEDIFIAVSKKSDLAFRVVVRHAWLNYILQVYLLEPPSDKERSRKFWINCLANLLESIDLDRMQSSVGGSSILSHFACILQRLLQVSEDSEHNLKDVADYYNLLRAIQALVDSKVIIDLEVIHSSMPLLGNGWTRKAFEANSLPLDDGVIGGENQKLLQDCKSRVRSIQVSLNTICSNQN